MSTMLEVLYKRRTEGRESELSEGQMLNREHYPFPAG